MFGDISVQNTLYCYSWKFFPNSTCCHWLLQGHMTSNNETVSHQNLGEGNTVQFMTLEDNSKQCAVHDL